MVIDARGMGCPKPVLMAEEELSKMGEGIVEILVDNEASVKNIERFAKKSGFYAETAPEEKHWRVKIVKGYPCEVTPEVHAAESGPAGGGKDLLLVIGSDILGKDEELGRTLMKAFLETMKIYKQLPHTIFLLNAGVKLATIDEEIVAILKEFEKTGVEIYSCGTCLKFYKLENMIKVGHWGTMNNVVEGMQDFKKTVWVG